MTEKEFKYYQERALRYILNAIVNTSNQLPDFTEDQKEDVINSVFNIMLNSLEPEAAIVWNEEILSFSETLKSKNNVNDIMNQIEELKDFKSNI